MTPIICRIDTIDRIKLQENTIYLSCWTYVEIATKNSTTHTVLLEEE